MPSLRPLRPTTPPDRERLARRGRGARAPQRERDRAREHRRGRHGHRCAWCWSKSSWRAGYLVFYTNYGSRKAVELEATGRAAAVIYWHELGRQVRFEGVVVRSPEAESDAYFATRPRQSQINAWSSEQSRSLADCGELETPRGESRGRARRGPRRKRCRAPHSGAVTGCGSMPSSCGSRAHDRFTSAFATNGAWTRDAYTFAAGRWSWHRLQP